MDIRQKLMIGVVGLKEMVAKRDAEISTQMHDGIKPEDDEALMEDFHDNGKVRELVETMLTLMDDPILDASIEMLTTPGKPRPRK